MTCEHFHFGTVSGIICHRGKRGKDCSFCHARGAGSFECDYPVTTKKSGTCDAVMCAKCKKNVGENRDFCPPHARHAEKHGDPAQQVKLPLPCDPDCFSVVVDGGFCDCTRSKP